MVCGVYIVRGIRACLTGWVKEKVKGLTRVKVARGV